MIPSRYEYLAVVIMFQFLLSTLFGPRLLKLARSRSFWLGLALFATFGTILELIALSMGWWRFTPAKFLGLHVAGIPLEELCLMVQLYAALVAAWESFADDVE